MPYDGPPCIWCNLRRAFLTVINVNVLCYFYFCQDTFIGICIFDEIRKRPLDFFFCQPILTLEPQNITVRLIISKILKSDKTQFMLSI
jgi:hypothetical protein